MADENLNWYDGLNLEDENVGVIQNKGWTDANSIIKSYRELEKASGRDKNDFIAIPKGDSPDLSEVWSRLGRPDSADGYDLPDSEVAKAAREALFKAGITQSQAKQLEEWFHGFAEAQQKTIDENNAAEAQKRHEAGVEGLKKLWGADFSKNDALAGSVVKALGLSSEQMDLMGEIMGVENLGKLLLSAAERTDSESPLTGYRQSGGETKEMAALKIAEMQSDPEIVTKLAKGDEKVAEEFRRLAAIAAGGK